MFKKWTLFTPHLKYLEKHKNISVRDIIFGGYELIFTAKKTNEKKIQELSNKLGITLTNIGVLTRKVNNNNTVKLFHKNNEISIAKFDYEH
ncbi:MAG: thiamine monophosphate kinase [Rickettsiales bacterium]